MGGKRRNRNKADREDFAIFASKCADRNNAQHESSDDSTDMESCDTEFTITDDGQCTTDESEDSRVSKVLLCDRLSDSMNRAMHKNIGIRMMAYDELASLLMRNYAPSEFQKWKATLVDVIEKGLKKTDEEAFKAALLAALISVQLSDTLNDDMETVLRVMCQLCMDASRSVSLRSQCARAITICSFLCALQSDLIAHAANTLRSVWIGTKTNTSSSSLFSITLSGWSLLISQAGSETLEVALADEPKLCTFVDSAQVEVRLSTGEALAILHEAATETFGRDYRFPNEKHLLDAFAALSSDSLKFRGKKDKRIQRFTFRQIYTSIKERQAPSSAVKFGNETLLIDSCAKKLLYDFVCGVIHSGMNKHLRLNTIMREWFNLGPVLEKSGPKMAKPQRVAIRNAISKTRDLQRSRQRDKRSGRLC